MTTSSILGITYLADGQVNQFAAVNAAIAALEAATNDSLSVDLSAGSYTLTAAEYRGYVRFFATGHAVARTLTLQAIKRAILVRNAGTAVLSVVLSTTTVLVQPGDTRLLYTDGTAAGLAALTSALKQIVLDVGDETTAITTGVAKKTFRMPHAMTVTAVRASLSTAQASGSILTVDINDGGTTILSTKLTIDNTEKTSTTAATAPVISDTALADDAEITINVDQIGDGTAAGLKVYLIGVPA